jgi:hypothetical protein
MHENMIFCVVGGVYTLMSLQGAQSQQRGLPALRNPHCIVTCLTVISSTLLCEVPLGSALLACLQRLQDSHSICLCHPAHRQPTVFQRGVGVQGCANGATTLITEFIATQIKLNENSVLRQTLCDSSCCHWANCVVPNVNVLDCGMLSKHIKDGPTTILTEPVGPQV